MISVILQGLQLAISVFEVWLCYQLMYCTVLEKKYLSKSEKAIIWGNILVLGILLGYNRELLFFSNIMLLFCVLITGLCVWLIKRRNILLILEIVMGYYSLLSLFDFFFGFLSMLPLQEAFGQQVYFGGSFWRIFIFILSRIIMFICVYFIRKKSVELEEIALEHQRVLIIFSIVSYAVLRRYQIVLSKMVKGENDLDGTSGSLSLLTVVIIATFVGMLVLKYRNMQKENKFLLLREEMSKQNYHDMFIHLEKNRQLVHDIKNHFVVLKGLEKEGDLKKIHNYLEEISEDYLEAYVYVWTGHRILDLVLNQKKAEAEKKGIFISIDAVSISDIYLGDNEICSLFGNLLDNAIEACEQIKTEKKWIAVEIKIQKAMLFIGISNSIGKLPLMKNGHWVTTKTNIDMHGYGLKIVNRIVEKYEGVISYRIEDNAFYVEMSFFDMKNFS